MFISRWEELGGGFVGGGGRFFRLYIKLGGFVMRRIFLGVFEIGEFVWRSVRGCFLE